ncbi:hypothetical protein HRU45_03880, partial [Candidatus Dependentiae bacterium]|nr:hypothetical protein [Candidatus Dependentiae bacterium]
AISNLSKNEKKQTILGLYHKYFVDAQIIHTVYEKRNEQNIFICAGAAHIERTLPILQKLGYEHQASEGNEYYNPDTQQFSEPDTLDVAQTFKQLDEKVPAGIPVHNDRMNGAIVWLLLVFASILFILHRNRKQKRYIISGIQ